MTDRGDRLAAILVDYRRELGAGEPSGPPTSHRPGDAHADPTVLRPADQQRGYRPPRFAPAAPAQLTAPLRRGVTA